MKMEMKGARKKNLLMLLVSEFPRMPLFPVAFDAPMQVPLFFLLCAPSVCPKHICGHDASMLLLIDRISGVVHIIDASGWAF